MPLAIKILLVSAIIGASVGAALAVPSLRQLLIEMTPPSWFIRIAAWRRGIHVDHEQSVTTLDGTRLIASLYRPAGAPQRIPTILIMVPYHRLSYGEGYNNALYFASHGYAVLVQDLRGTGGSGGEFLPWDHTADDVVATIDWITKQPWSDGTIGTFGCSALGETQLVAQSRAPSGWRAMIPIGAGGANGSLGGRYDMGFFEGGIFQLASGFGWFVEHGSKRPEAPPAVPFDRMQILRQLPIAEIVSRVRPAPNGYVDFLSTPLDDSKWRQWGYLSNDSRMRIPALMVNTWGDQTLSATLAIAEHWRKVEPGVTAGRLKTIIAPGNHCEHGGTASRFGELDIENGVFPFREAFLRWFDYWLKGRGDALAEVPAYTYYIVGAGAWRTSETWPPTEAVTQRWWLGSGGRANGVSGDGSLTLQPRAGASGDSWRYDPADPVPTRGGPICCTGSADISGPAEQADVEQRNDVLVYTSSSLDDDLVIVGPIRLHVEVSSDALDTDLVARLTDVFPNGRSISIQEGALRLRYRDGFASPQLMAPGQRVAATVDLRDLAYRLQKGHRLRLHVTSSSFPRLERNLNTGGNNATETRMVIATNHVHYDKPGNGSWLELSVLPNASLLKAPISQSAPVLRN